MQTDDPWWLRYGLIGWGWLLDKPWAFIVVGLLLVGFGAYLLGQRSNKVSATDPSISSPAQASAAAQATKHYFPAEKAELGNLLSQISDHLNKEGIDAYNQGYRLGSPPLGTPTKAQLSELMQRVNKVRDLTVTMSQAIWDTTIYPNQKLNSELLQTVGQNSGHVPLTVFQQTLNNYHRDLSIFVTQFDQMIDEVKAWISDTTVRRDAQNVFDAANRFHEWIQNSKSQIESFRELLR